MRLMHADWMKHRRRRSAFKMKAEDSDQNLDQSHEINGMPIHVKYNMIAITIAE